MKLIIIDWVAIFIPVMVGIFVGVGVWGTKGIGSAIRNFIFKRTDGDIDELKRNVKEILEWIDKHDSTIERDRAVFNKLRYHVRNILIKLKNENK